jgi:hypothetical protein
MESPADDGSEVDLVSEVSITDPVEFDYSAADISAILAAANVSADPGNA